MRRLLSAIILLCAAPLCAQNLNDTTPAAPPGSQNVHFQKDSSLPVNISAYTSSGSSYNAGYGLCNGMTPGYSPLGTASTPGVVYFGPSNYWHTDISAAPVDPNSAAIISFIGPTTAFHPDFGQSFGIPFSIVDSSITPLAYVTTSPMFEPNNSEADNAAMPIPPYVPIEGLPPACTSTGGDQHVILLDKNQCVEYDMDNAKNCSGTWTADYTTLWDWTNYNERPAEWTSVDAAGLPLLPGLVRRDEASLGLINHALRVTMQSTHNAYVFPATHWAGNDDGIGYASPIPMGMRLRLKSSVDISGYSPINQVILRAFQTYGLIVADNGSSMFVTGVLDGFWDDTDLHNLTAITANDFEVIQMPPWYTVLTPGYQLTFSGMTNATFLNGQTVTNTLPGRGWNSATATVSYTAYPLATEPTGAIATITLNTGSVGTLPAVWTAPVTSVSVVGTVLTVNLATNSGSNIPNGATPVISSFTASPTSITSGQSSTLSWATSGGSYEYLTQCDVACPSVGSLNPQVGFTRGTSAVVSPTTTTTYTLNVLNGASQFFTQQSVTVTVH